MLCPVQMTAFGVTVTMGKGFTVTVTCAVDVQPALSVKETLGLQA
jgi:hypothetical protein